MCRQHGDKRLVALDEELTCISKSGRKNKVDNFPYELCKNWLNKKKAVQR